MWNQPTSEQLATIPKLYETEHIPMEDKIIHLHFFIGGCDWFVIEYDEVDTFFGFTIINGDLKNAEWGYILFSELKSIKIAGYLEIDCDLYWEPKTAREVDLICRAQGWPSTTGTIVEGGGEQHAEDS